MRMQYQDKQNMFYTYKSIFLGRGKNDDPSFKITLHQGQVSISPTFYWWLYRMKVLLEAYLCLHFRFVLFWCKNIGSKAALKMLVKLTTGHSTR